MPQNHENDRDRLPVWLGQITTHDLRVMDLLEMQAEGLVDVLAPLESYPDQVDYLMSRDRHAYLVDSLGMAGIYEAHVRATGPVYVCPDWCEADHPRAAIFDPTGGGPGHLAYETQVSTAAGDVRVDVGAGEGLRPTVCAQVAEDMTAAQARQLAAALLNAADVLDKITTG